MVKKYDAIVAVSENGDPHLVKLLTDKHWLIDSIAQYDDLAEHSFPDFIEGLYFAIANGVGEGEDFEVQWHLSDSIFLLE